MRRWIMMGLWLLSAGCGEPIFENAGSPNNLLDDRKACAMEVEQGPAGRAYRQNPTAYPDYVSQIVTAMDRCIEGKGWKQVTSQQEQQPVRATPPSQLAQPRLPAPRSDSKVADNTIDSEWPENGSENTGM